MCRTTPTVLSVAAGERTGERRAAFEDAKRIRVSRSQAADPRRGVDGSGYTASSYPPPITFDPSVVRRL
jgi:hypothetical protein